MSSPVLVRPAMPDAAKQNTVAGAKAFVYYFFDVLNYANAALDPSALQSAYTQDCKACIAIAQTIKNSQKELQYLYKGKYAVNWIQLAPNQVPGDYVGLLSYSREEAGATSRDGKLIGAPSSPEMNKQESLVVRWQTSISQFSMEYIGPVNEG